MSRPSLPLDPLLQLDAGALSPPSTITIPASGQIVLAPADPMRVALFVMPPSSPGNWSISPSSPVAGPAVTAIYTGAPTTIHCRDYPGVTQAEWWLVGSPGLSVTWWAYSLSDLWR